MPLTMEVALRDGAMALRNRANRQERALNELESILGSHAKARSRIASWRKSADALDVFRELKRTVKQTPS